MKSMISSILGLLLVMLALFALALQRFYSCVPTKELKRLASRGDHLAAALYRPVAYGSTLRLLLWIVFGLSISGGFLLFMSGLVLPAAFVAIMLSMIGVVVLQSLRLTVRSAKVAVTAAPALHWLLVHVHVPLHGLARLLGSLRTHDAHSGLYEKDDLAALLRQQKEQPDNRIDPDQLALMERALTFDDRQAADVVVPWGQIKMVKTDDHIGPVLLKELHDSGQTSFLVYNGTPKDIVGTLFLRDAVHAKAGGQVSTIMHANVCYVHEDFTLRQVLEAFVRTSQFMVVVVNAFEEGVGVITLQHLLSELAGDLSEKEEVPYEDRARVASFKFQLVPQPVAVTDELPEPEDPSPEETEVVK